MKKPHRLFSTCLALAFLNPAQLFAGEFSWQFLGPAAPVVSQLASVTRTPNVLLANTDSAFYRSTDGGASWQLSMSGLEALAGYVSGFVVNPTNPDIVLLPIAPRGEIYRSIDGGKTWAGSKIGVASSAKWLQLAFHPTQPNRAYAMIAGDGIYRSDDAGASWRKTTTITETGWIDWPGIAAVDSLANLYIGFTVPVSPSISQGCISSAAENGAAWSTPECFSGVLNNIVTGVDDAIYVLTSATLYKKDNRNAAWRALLSDRSAQSLLLPTQAGESFYLGTRDGVMQSIDQGESWTSPSPMSATLPSVAALTSSASILYAGTSLGVFKSVDQARNWNTVNTGLPPMWVTGFATTARSATVQYAITNGRIVSSSDDWATFRPVSLGKAVAAVNAISANPGNSSELLAATSNFSSWSVPQGSIYRSTDGGASWTSVLDKGRMGCIVRDPSQSERIYVGGSDGLYVSNDNGASWRLLSAAPQGFSYYGIDGLAIAPDNPRKLFISQGAALNVSDDGGVTWRTVFTLNDNPIGLQRQILFDRNQPATMYLSDRWVVYKSTDSGEHWQSIYTVQEQQPDVQTLLLDPDMPSQLYLGLINGLLLSKDGGNSWVATDFPALRAYSLQFKGNKLYVATDKGIYRTERDVAVSEGAGGGGGCSVGASRGDAIDPMLWLLVAAALVWHRRRVTN